MIIAICDDEKSAIESLKRELEKAVEKLQVKMDIYEYQTGEELLADITKQQIEVVLLDIDMPGMSGMETANCLMEKCPLLNIIFLTNREDMVFQALKYRPLRFIRKNHVRDELTEAIEAAMKKIASEMYVVSFGRGKIAIKDILYIESNKHYIDIHMQEKIQQFRGRISDCEKGLGDYGFVRVHKGYLVNIRYIESFLTDTVVLDNKERIPVSRNRIEEVRVQYMKGVEKFINGFHI
ncbi:MAG: LytTR family DNA-binding domain-containing protein [Lachnospiraceae bacterium]|nr:LytTR family DNA-binding domain-containing protein [Lachnospiraceae bacterium]